VLPPVVVGVFFCELIFAQADADTSVKSRLVELRERTSPPGPRIANSSGLIRKQFSVAASWECETDWDWQRYSEWVKSQLGGFEIIRADGSEIVFGRPVGSDTESIVLRTLSASPRLRVHLNFTMYPQ